MFRGGRRAAGVALLFRAAERTPRGLMGNEVALWLCWLSSAWQLFTFALSDKRRLYSLSRSCFCQILESVNIQHQFSCPYLHIDTYQIDQCGQEGLFFVVQFNIHAYQGKRLNLFTIGFCHSEDYNQNLYN